MGFLSPWDGIRAMLACIEPIDSRGPLFWSPVANNETPPLSSLIVNHYRSIANGTSRIEHASLNEGPRWS